MKLPFFRPALGFSLEWALAGLAANNAKKSEVRQFGAVKADM